MEWEKEALQEIEKVPFFIRKRVKETIERQASDNGLSVVSLSQVKSARTHFLKRFDKGGADVQKEDVKLYEVRVCNGEQLHCPFMIRGAKELHDDIVSLMERLEVNRKRLSKVKGMILPHHRLKVSISTCPNACSQPQIKKIGIIFQAVPVRGDGECSNCKVCIDTCQEKAIKVREIEGGFSPVIDHSLCMNCGMCARVCKSGALKIERTGYKLLADGRLGRHPQLAREIIGLCDRDELLNGIEKIIREYCEDR